jgi:hypothetical protein
MVFGSTIPALSVWAGRSPKEPPSVSNESGAGVNPSLIPAMVEIGVPCELPVMGDELPPARSTKALPMSFGWYGFAT